MEGLIPLLKSLSDKPGISTITPGVISRVKGRSERLTIRISTEIRGGYKLLARKGRTAQEIFIITSLTRSNLKEEIDNRSI